MSASMPNPNPDTFPRLPLLGAAALICFAIGAAATGRLSGAGVQQPVSTVLEERDLRFADRADGAVLVFDAGTQPATTQPFAVETGQNGFLRGVLRGFARTRRAEGVGAEAPFHLTAWADGRLTLTDPATGRHTDLEAFGPANVPVFAQFLPDLSHKPAPGPAQ